MEFSQIKLTSFLFLGLIVTIIYFLSSYFIIQKSSQPKDQPRIWTFKSSGSHLKHQHTDKYSRLAKVCPNWYYLVEPVRQCHIPPLAKGNLFETYHNVTTDCSPHLAKILKLEVITNLDDAKGFINFTNSTITNSCLAVTLGVGNDTEAEKKLLQRVPRCRMLGADPEEPVGKIFKNIGTYDHVAVGDRNSTVNASVLTNGQYVFKEVRVIPMLEFLKKHGIKEGEVIDYFFLDAEGAEFGLLPYMSHGGPIDTANIAICQLSVELHCGLEQYGTTNEAYDLMMSQFILNSDYLPIWTSKGCHNRYFFVNYRDDRCIDRFFKHLC